MKKEVVAGEEGKGNGAGCSAEGEHTCTGSFIWRLLSLAGRNLGGIQGRVSAEYSVFFQVCPFGVVVFIDWSVPGQGVFRR